MMQAVPNSGIMGDDRMDKLRGDAIVATREHPIPAEVGVYILELEVLYLGMRHQQKLQLLSEVGWTSGEEG